MSKAFFEQPILNSPYTEPNEHWEFTPEGQPTGNPIGKRRKAEFFTPIPKSRKRSKKNAAQATIEFQDDLGLSTDKQAYQTNDTIMAIRKLVGEWRLLPEGRWNVTPTTQRLLKWWRKDDWPGRRPFFCQVEAVEVMIWLTEVAPGTATGKRLLEELEGRSRAANPDLFRLCLKLATGAGKTTVMAMLIAWHTLNSVRSPTSKRFTRGFLLVAPGITIRDRLRVLMPNDPDNYYRSFQMIPHDLMEDMQKARIVITNYHAFKLRERLGLAKGTREFLRGRGDDIDTLETEGQMIQRVMPDLMGLKNILVINDEAHHCYREKPADEADEEATTVDDLKGDEKKEAKEESEAARMWITGLETVQRKLGISRVVDLSATPFFLRGSGYIEGTIFGWTCSDFSLMDAIECGIVKLPRVPVADNIPGQEVPVFRDLWENIRKDMPKKSRGTSELDPLSLPTKLQTALTALYGHYEETHRLWKQAGISVPPCFIIVCNNTATSKLIYDYISGFRREGNGDFVEGRFDLFWNYDKYGEPYSKPNTLLIDSKQLESGEALDAKFLDAASDEIERFKYEIRQRNSGSKTAPDADNLNEADILREVMNTVGEKDKLGESIRCVVSVSMLTEGWDTNTVTHILGVRAFGTQLLCEQVVGRALRRRNYQLNEAGKFDVEYADILGIPFNFASEAVQVTPKPPVERLNVKAVRPDRDKLEIIFPRVQGYRTESLPNRLTADFQDDHAMRLTPDDIGATMTLLSGIVGEEQNLTLEHTKDMRQSTIIMHLTTRLMMTRFRDANGEPQMHLFGTLKPIVKRWLDTHLECVGGTYPAQLMYQELADKACNRINDAINQSAGGNSYIRAILDPYNPRGTSHFVNFHTTKDAWGTRADKSPVNYAVLDSGWEGEFCRIVESHPRVLRYVKNQGLGLEVPYLSGGQQKTYIPDFIVLIDDGHGPEDPLQLIVEVKGYRREDVKDKSNTMKTYWVPGVNKLKAYGRWAFAEFRDVYLMEADFDDKITAEMERIMAENVGADAGAGEVEKAKR
jgi:type III restriction enzyme